MTRVWYTSDSHFGHRAMIERAWRPQFTSVADMDECMITRWNEEVHPDDTVWHLGDFGLGGMMHFLQIVPKLHGTIHLITGNHDHPWPGLRNSYKYQRAWLDAGFASIQQYMRRRISGQSVLLNHFPYDVDNRHGVLFRPYQPQDVGDWLIHGHVHGAWRIKRKQINVGVDVNDFRPVDQDEIVKIMSEGPQP